MQQPTPTRIVVRGLNWLGDAVMSTPALQRLRESFPAAAIALLTPEKLEDLWQRHPDVDEVIPFSSRDGVFSVARRIRPRKFEAALVFPNSPRSALEVFLGRVPRRYGIARPWRNSLLTDVIASPRTEIFMRKKSAAEVRRLVRRSPESWRARYPESGHHSYRYLHIGAAFGARAEPCAPRLTVTTEEISQIRQKFSSGDANTPIVGFNPGAEYGPAKRWPMERFIEAARRIHGQTGAACWIFGGSGERGLGQHFVEELRKSAVAARSLAGETSLRELCAALKACSVVITNDTGPMHVAAAVGTPVVAPFGSTSPELTGPAYTEGKGHLVISGNAPCAPCFRRSCPIDLRCLNDVPVEEVVDSALQAFRSARRS
jgi:heptosyltransferase-2